MMLARNDNMSLLDLFIRVYLEYEDQQLQFLNGGVDNRAGYAAEPKNRNDEMESLSRMTESIKEDDNSKHPKAALVMDSGFAITAERTIEVATIDEELSAEGINSLKKRKRISQQQFQTKINFEDSNSMSGYSSKGEQ